MLSRVVIQNFKSIGEPGVDLELKPLTFLVGPNGGGKSSILEAIAFSGQRGESVRWRFEFSRREDLHHKHEPNTLSVKVFAPNDLSGEPAVYALSSEYGGRKREHFWPEPPEPGSTVNSDSGRSPLGQEIMERLLFGMVYPIRATRGAIVERKQRDEVTWVGGGGEHTLDILDQLRYAGHVAKWNRIQGWASRFGMRNVAASGVGGQLIEGSYTDREATTPLNVYYASTGNRQVLPIVVQLFWADPNSVTTIEEPEISLHPKAQIDVLEMFAQTINEDKQIIATTHSHFFMQAIGYAIHKGWLASDQIAVYHVEKGEDGTKADRLPLGENGYIEGWIPSFTEIERQLLLEWAETLPRE